jgi:hypothetical protein
MRKVGGTSLTRILAMLGTIIGAIGTLYYLNIYLNIW